MKGLAGYLLRKGLKSYRVGWEATINGHELAWVVTDYGRLICTCDINQSADFEIYETHNHFHDGSELCYFKEVAARLRALELRRELVGNQSVYHFVDEDLQALVDTLYQKWLNHQFIGCSDSEDWGAPEICAVLGLDPSEHDGDYFAGEEYERVKSAMSNAKRKLGISEEVCGNFEQLPGEHHD
ncbi:MAG TPA: hypothetical protein VLF21_03410 [Candidatus Saccharimonadales bacterium]|nr:hypothetical protein [Candidatus Saccharimonadales bacterium]